MSKRANHTKFVDKLPPSPPPPSLLLLSVPHTLTMFSRQLATRTARAAAARSYATVSEASGVKVAGIDNGQPTTTISVVVKAGSRYETRPGVAHALKNFAFKVSLWSDRDVGDREFGGGCCSSGRKTDAERRRHGKFNG